MSTSDILEALSFLNSTDQLQVAETALRLIQQNRHRLTSDQRRQQLKIAAMAAIDDYSTDSELIVFTDLDGENFYDEFKDDLNLDSSDE